MGHTSSMVARAATRYGSGTSVAEDGGRLRDAWHGSLYRDHTEHHRRHDPAFLREITLGPGDRLLDIGCGDGAVSSSLAARFPDAAVVGIDSAPDMVSTASQRSLPNLSFELCRAQDIAFVDHFTVVISIAALHWVPGADHPVFLAGLHRALRAGGRFLAEFGGVGNVARTVGIMTSIARTPDFALDLGDVADPWFFPDPRDYEAVLADAGFIGVTCELVTQQREFTEAEYAGWLVSQTLLPWTARLDEPRATAFTARAVAEASAAARDGDAYRETFTRVRVMAAKS